MCQKVADNDGGGGQSGFLCNWGCLAVDSKGAATERQVQLLQWKLKPNTALHVPLEGGFWQFQAQAKTRWWQHDISDERWLSMVESKSNKLR